MANAGISDEQPADPNAVTEYDVIVLGLGPGGEEVAERLAEAGKRVLGIEPHLVGGECPYYGCIPSKMILRAAETLSETSYVNKLAGSASAEPDFAPVATRIREEATDDWNDQVAAERFERLGGHLIRSAGRFAGRDSEGRAVVEAGGRRFVARLGTVVATGTAPVIPPIPGLSELGVNGLSPDGPIWTNREIVQIKQAPESLIVIGGGAVGSELGQGLAKFGTSVTQIEVAARILGPEEPEVAEVITAVFRRQGIRVELGAKVIGVGATKRGVSVSLADGRTLEAERLLLAAGRRQHIPELALDTVGLDPHARVLDVDDHMRVAEGIYAVGDVTGKGPFTHVAVWQARVLIAHLLRRTEPFGGYHGLAWVTFTDPEVGRVGMTEQQARDAGIDVVTGCAQIRESSRGWIHGPGNDGFVKLVVDAEQGVLVGASVVSPHGGEVLSMLTLAVHARVPLPVLASMHYAFPTLHRAVLDAVQSLPAAS